MNYQLPSLKHPTIKQLLVSKLLTALDLYISDCSLLTQVKGYIPLYRVKQQRFLYVSAIAFHLSKTTDLSALEIAHALAKILDSLTDEPDFSVQVVPPGLIHLELTESFLAAWLQHLIVSPPKLQSTQQYLDYSEHSSRLFAVQYAHARCCSLLQLAQREKLIILQPAPDTGSALWLVTAPNPIPWLDQQYWHHPAQVALLTQLVDLLDTLYCHYQAARSPNWHQAALNLSQSFQYFYSHCRIWGEVKNQNIQLAQARLGLVLIVQSVLRLILQHHLGLIAPIEL